MYGANVQRQQNDAMRPAKLSAECERKIIFMEKLKVAVLFGGASSEHEVSRVSAASVISHIPADQYDIVPVGITKEGAWLRFRGPVDALPDGSWEKDLRNRPAFIPPDAAVHGLVELTPDGRVETTRLDVVFPVLHGKNGEDGTVQGLLTLARLPFVGCDTAASAVCMDKAITKMLLGSAGIRQAKWRAFTARELADDEAGVLGGIEEALGFPLFVKPANAGSSVGITKVKSREAFFTAAAEALRHDCKAVCEEAVAGKEIECAVLGNDDIAVSVCGEIKPANEFYDYQAKYENADSQLYIPARIPQEKAGEIRATAAKAYRLLGCAGMVRMDFFLREDGAVLLNEPNTIPGFTSISMYPKLFEASGIPYGELLGRLIRLAMERKF